MSDFEYRIALVTVVVASFVPIFDYFLGKKTKVKNKKPNRKSGRK